MEESLTLLISQNDTRQGDNSVFYVNPQRLNLLYVLSDSVFESCLIENTLIENLSSIHFAYILRTLKPNSPVKVVVYQPITVMQEYDAKQVEANAKLAGFNDFHNTVDTFKDQKTGKDFNTIAVNFIRPVRNPNKIEVEVTTTTTTTTVKGGKRNDEKKTVTTNSRGSNNTPNPTPAATTKKTK
jgi:hypothetical protein